MPKDITITIPQEITEIFDFSKPLYLYIDNHDYRSYRLYLNKTKLKNDTCYGLIQLDENHSFTISSATAKRAKIETQYIVFKNCKNIYIQAYNDDSSVYRESNSTDSQHLEKNLKLIIPKEILNLGGVNFNKNTYLFKGPDNVFFFANENYKINKDNSIKCFGKVKLGIENDIELTPNMYTAMGITSCDNIVLGVKSCTIVISRFY